MTGILGVNRHYSVLWSQCNSTRLIISALSSCLFSLLWYSDTVDIDADDTAAAVVPYYIVPICRMTVPFSLNILLLDRPFCERSILYFAHVSFSFFFSQLTFSDVCKPIFSKLFHMTWLYSKKKRCYANFLKVPPNKNEGRKPQISPNLASNRNIICAVTRNVEGK